MQFFLNNSKLVKQGTLVETGQTRPCRFSFALIEGDQVFPLHTFVLCRDYLNDVLVWNEEKCYTHPIYGFSYRGEYDKNQTVFCMLDAEHLKNNIGELNEIEIKLGIRPTLVYETTKKEDDTIVVIGDAFWQKTTLHLSWYTAALRALSYPEKVPLDASKETTIVHINKICNQPEKMSGNYPWKNVPVFSKLPFLFAKLNVTIKRNAWTTTDSMHSYNGFFSMFYTYYNNYTYKDQITELLKQEEKQTCDASLATVY